MRHLVGPKHMVIPDTQCKPGVDMDHMAWAGRYAADRRPDVIVHLGDHYDMASLSSYDRGKRQMEGRRYEDDIAAGRRGLELFEKNLRRYAPRGYRPRKVVTLGNHENRIQTAIDDNAQLEGKLSMNDLAFKEFGWEVVPFLTPIRIHGIVYCHFFPIGPKGRVTNAKHGAPSAEAQCRRMMATCTAGHRQGLDCAIVHTPGATYRGMIAGSFYRHTEPYLSPMGQNVWHGVLIKHDIDVKTGFYNLMEVDMRFLERRFA